MTDFNSKFQAALDRYNNGASVAELLPEFLELSKEEPGNGGVYSCLAWLYMLSDQDEKALKAAKKSIKLDPKAPQARVNLVLAMLANNEKGVRDQVDVLHRMMGIDQEIGQDILDNLEDGLQRKPDWAGIKKLKNWLFN